MQPRTLLICLALIALASSPESALSQLGAQLETPEGAHRRTNDDSNLKRDVTFELSEQEETVKLFRADPRLFEQHYAAHVELYRPPFKAVRIDSRRLLADRLQSPSIGSFSLLYAELREKRVS